MNFFEAMKAIDEGKIVLSPGMFKCKKINGHIHWWADHDGIWKPARGVDASDMTGEWEIYIEPKDERGLWVKGANYLDLVKRGVDDNSIFTAIHRHLETFDDPKILNQWINALQTFMKLKGHPLAVKATEDGQFFIHISLEYADVPPIIEDQLAMKIYNFSPMFETMADAETTLEDIGEENLVKMAKVFQGIYE